MQSTAYQRADRLRALYSELRALLALERGEEWLWHIDPIVAALAPPFESEAQCEATIAEARRRFNALLSYKGGFSDFYIHRDDPHSLVEANRRLSQLKQILCAG